MRKTKDFLRDTRGNFGAAMALMIVPLSLVVGLSVDLSSALSRQSKLQATADAAALAAAEMQKGNAEGQRGRDAEALRSVEKLVPQDERESDQEFRVSVKSPTSHTREVTVQVSTSMPTTFMSLAGIHAINLQATATARKTEPEHCLYALDPVSSGAFSVSGAGQVSIPNCGIQVNSSSASALQQSGSGKILAESISVAGDYVGSGYKVSPMTNEPSLPDPLAEIPTPVIPGGCDYKNTKLADLTIPAGRVFCEHISLDGSVVFSPGMYYFKNAVLSLGARARVTGDRVTLVFDSRSSLIQASGDGSIQVSAPAVGDYAGIAIFGARATEGGVPSLSLAGNEQYDIDGTIYAPRHQVRIKGATDPVSDTRSNWIVAWQLVYSGDTNITFDGYDAPLPDGLGAPRVTLVR